MPRLLPRTLPLLVGVQGEAACDGRGERRRRAVVAEQERELARDGIQALCLSQRGEQRMDDNGAHDPGMTMSGWIMERMILG